MEGSDREAGGRNAEDGTEISEFDEGTGPQGAGRENEGRDGKSHDWFSKPQQEHDLRHKETNARMCSPETSFLLFQLAIWRCILAKNCLHRHLLEHHTHLRRSGHENLRRRCNSASALGQELAASKGELQRLKAGGQDVVRRYEARPLSDLIG